MWDELKIGLAITMLCVSLPSSLSAASSVAGYTIQPTEQSTNIVMSMSQWTELKQELIEQENDLNLLRIKLKMLRGNSTEQIKQLDKLSRQLEQTKSSLMSAQASLTECQNALKESRESLQTLKVQIKQMEHKQTVLRRQRDVWAAIAALSLGGVIARR